jgi:hypothetical protein
MRCFISRATKFIGQGEKSPPARKNPALTRKVPGPTPLEKRSRGGPKYSKNIIIFLDIS